MPKTHSLPLVSLQAGTFTSRANNVHRRTNQVEWRPRGPNVRVDSDHPGRAVLHGALAVAEIYEELNDLHEETVAIVLAQNKEVKRQLSALKKEISDMRRNLADLHTRSHQSGFGILTLVLFHVVFVFIILAILS